MPYTIPTQAITVINLHRLEVCGVGWKLSEEIPKERGRVLSEVLILHVVSELHHPDTIFSLHFLAYSNNIKIENYPLSVSKDLALK